MLSSVALSTVVALRAKSSTPLNVQEFELVTSPALFEELVGVLGRPVLVRRIAWNVESRNVFLDGLRHAAIEVQPGEHLDVVKSDPDDNRVLEAAIAGEADYIVTGDRDLLDLVVFRGVRIVTPAQFISVLRSLDV